MANSASQKRHASAAARENRVAIRKDAYLKGADLIIGEDKLTIAASVLDSSSRGLRLYVDSPICIPERFTVVLSHSQSEHKCKLVWQNEKEIGLEIIS